MDWLTWLFITVALNLLLAGLAMIGFNYGIAPLGFPDVGFIQSWCMMLFVRCILYGVATPKAK